MNYFFAAGLVIIFSNFSLMGMEKKIEKQEDMHEHRLRSSSNPIAIVGTSYKNKLVTEHHVDDLLEILCKKNVISNEQYRGGMKYAKQITQEMVKNNFGVNAIKAIEALSASPKSPHKEFESFINILTTVVFREDLNNGSTHSCPSIGAGHLHFSGRYTGKISVEPVVKSPLHERKKSEESETHSVALEGEETVFEME